MEQIIAERLPWATASSEQGRQASAILELT